MKRIVVLALAAVLLGQAQLASADIVVAPDAFATTEGTIANFYPFAIDSLRPINVTPLTSQRYQQFYDSSLFGAYTSPLSIERVSFRPDSSYGSAFTATLPNIQISLSTTPRTIMELTNVFADNVGSDDTIIVNGSLTLSSSFTGPAGGPKDFDIFIDLATPFLYDPSQGNLLIDVRNYGGVAGDPPLGMVFDAEYGPQICRVYTSAPSLDGVNDLTALYPPAGIGLVTQFTFTPTDVPVVPVPGAVVLGIVGLSCVGWRMRRRTA